MSIVPSFNFPRPVVVMMPQKYTLYLPDDEEELSAWIEQMSNVFGSESGVLKKSVEHLKDDKGQKLQTLIRDDDNDSKFV